jgi:AcrR family transcriptional regulator
VGAHDPDRGKDTRTRLLDAAEVLFGERGSETVSLREISRAADARNVIAAQYWFTDRGGLVQALLDRHEPEVEARRHALLESYEAEGHRDVHELAGALVRPLAPKLDQGAGGLGYLRTLTEQLNSPSPSLVPLHLEREGSSMQRWSELVGPLLDDEAVRMHRRFLTVRFVVSELALRARRSGRRDDRLFVAHLIDLAAGLLLAPVSAESRRLRVETAGAARPGGEDA